MRQISFIFSGQGAQKPGMAKSLFDASKSVRDLFAELSEANERDISALCFESSMEELNQTKNTQPAMLAADLAAWSALKEKGIDAHFCAGFSLGEYAALVCAGVLTAFEAGKLVAARAKFMAECQNGGMAAVLGAEEALLEEICSSVKSGYVVPVNYNCPGQTVIAGEDEALKEAISALKERKIRALPLKVSSAFHCELMKDAAEKLFDEAKSGNYTFKEAKIPIICNVSAEPFDPSKENWAEVCKAHTKSPVLWEKSVRKLIEMGTGTFIECGYGKVLSGLNKRICPEIETFAVEDPAGLETAIAKIK